MRTLETENKISNSSGLNYNQQLRIKDSNLKKLSMTDLGNGSQMDFQSADRSRLGDKILIYLTSINFKNIQLIYYTFEFCKYFF